MHYFFKIALNVSQQGASGPMIVFSSYKEANTVASTLLYQLWKLLFVISKVFVNLSAFRLSSPSPPRRVRDVDGARLEAHRDVVGGKRTGGTGPGRTVPGLPAPPPHRPHRTWRPRRRARPLREGRCPQQRWRRRPPSSPPPHPLPTGSDRGRRPAGDRRWRQPPSRPVRQQGWVRPGPAPAAGSSRRPVPSGPAPARRRHGDKAPAANRAPLPLTSAPTRGSKMAASAAMVSAAAPAAGGALSGLGAVPRPPSSPPRPLPGPAVRGPGGPARGAARGGSGSGLHRAGRDEAPGPQLRALPSPRPRGLRRSQAGEGSPVPSGAL